MRVWPMMNVFMVATGRISSWKFAIPKVKQNQIKLIRLMYRLLNRLNFAAVVGFKCPTKVESDSPAARFWPFPRFAVQGDCHRLITCVEGYPRLISCGEDKVFDENTLTCEDPEYAASKCSGFGK